MDDELERKVNESFEEADPLGVQMRDAGFREVLPGDSNWITVAEASDPIRMVRTPRPE
jgi:hypothetical protein